VLDELRGAALGDQGLALGERPPEERIVDGSQLRDLCLELDAAGARALTLSGAHVSLTALAGQRAWWPPGSARRRPERTRVKEVAPQPSA
jgi:hypothetical protein